MRKARPVRGGAEEQRRVPRAEELVLFQREASSFLLYRSGPVRCSSSSRSHEEARMNADTLRERFQQFFEERRAPTHPLGTTAAGERPDGAVHHRGDAPAGAVPAVVEPHPLAQATCWRDKSASETDDIDEVGDTSAPLRSSRCWATGWLLLVAGSRRCFGTAMLARPLR